MLRARNLEKSFGSNRVLDHVDIQVPDSSITVLLGPSGAGKTVLLRALSLLEPPDAGEISIGRDIYHFPTDRRTIVPSPWPRLTVVFQQLFLWPHITLRRNIELVALQSDAAARIDELIDLFEMSMFIDRYPNEVSLGQRQRAALARALVLEPAYILLDEVTSALDVENVAVILSHLKDLRSKGIGVLLITHLLRFAREAADHVYFIDKGKILASGDRGIFDDPPHERFAKFVSVLEAAS